MPAASGVKVPYRNTNRQRHQEHEHEDEQASQVVGVANRIKYAGRAPTMNRIRMRKMRGRHLRRDDALHPAHALEFERARPDHADQEERQRQVGITSQLDAMAPVEQAAHGPRPRRGAPMTADEDLSGDRHQARTPVLSLIIDVSESTIPLGEFPDGFVEVFLLELRPLHRRDPELRVRDLPEQEVRDPQVAAGADQEVGVGRVGIVQSTGPIGLLVDLLRASACRP
jgi:hypothetical protein